MIRISIPQMQMEQLKSFLTPMDKIGVPFEYFQTYFTKCYKGDTKSYLSWCDKMLYFLLDL